MIWVIFIVGILAIGLWLAILVAPDCLRRIINFFSFGSRHYLIGLFRLLLGILILISTAQAKLWGYAVTMGILLSASGLSVFFLALKRTKTLIARIGNQPDFILRFLAIIALVIWALLVYSFLPAVSFPLR